MHVMTEILESAFIERLTRRLPRSPLQLNGLQETDAYLLRVPAVGLVLALTTDWVVEEIESGLYSDPYLIGWMTVTVNASDLAAVGAEPIGLLLNETLPPDTAPEFIERLQEGIREACSASGLYVLGGDTNISTRLELGGSALGLISDRAIRDQDLEPEGVDEPLYVAWPGLEKLRAELDRRPDLRRLDGQKGGHPRTRVRRGLR